MLDKKLSNPTSLTALGWQSCFQEQFELALKKWDSCTPARVVEHYKTEITVSTASENFNINLLSSMPELVVGDWLLLNNNQQFLQLLDRKTCFSRKAPGKKPKKQLIASNIDIAFIVSSMNDDFNLNRIERFLALVHASGAEPVIILSKKDKTQTPEEFVAAVQALDSNLTVKAINCLEMKSRDTLSPWLKSSVTIAMLGSSGVGKSTLINTILGENRQATGEIRAQDKKGRHTTTKRSLIQLNTGGLILDTPGIREVQLIDCKAGIASTFSDVLHYASQCRFNNCAHQAEPHCAVQQAIQSGDLNARRLASYFKLIQEEALHSTVRNQRTKK
ncbi:MAG: ribosome small subunit-dependent GTPase A [Legionella sp.]|nr:ribosome small subunit-dependent GTPase A [Legionella sp.]